MTERSEVEQLKSKIKTLSDVVWDGRVDEPAIDQWLNNFTGERESVELERLSALRLLSHFTFFGVREFRVIMQALYRDCFQYPLIRNIRRELKGTKDSERVQAHFLQEQAASKFLGMGNPSESGSHILYYFRQENGLSRKSFINQHQLFTGPVSDSSTSFADSSLRRLVWVDDLLGSGQQAHEYSRGLLQDIRAISERSGQPVELLYLVAFAKTDGLKHARTALFDDVRVVHELDDSQAVFSQNSRIYTDSEHSAVAAAGESIARHYGEKLLPGHGLGYRNGQMMLGFQHNIPDNTLPIFWCDEMPDYWTPIFPRYPKV